MAAIVKLKQLESDLEGLISFTNPKVNLEQYQTPARFAAEALHYIHISDGIANKTILDLGCGCGILGLGCIRLSAIRVFGVDIDDEALSIATENKTAVGLSDDIITFLQKDVLQLTQDDFADTKFDMVVMNPPFGTRQASIDESFVVKGLEFAPIVYSVHKSTTRSHWKKAAGDWKKHGWNVRVQACLTDQHFKLQRTYRFHKKHEQEILVDLMRFCR